MITGIKDPNIASGFAALANILAPNASGLIDADLARVKRDGMLADTSRTGADQARIEAVTRGTDATTATTTSQNAAAAAFAAIMAEPGFNPADPATRGRLASAAAGMDDGLAKGPGALTGFSSFVDPNFAGDADAFSNILLGTGVVSDYGNTPAGFGDDQSRLRADAIAKNAVTLQTNTANNQTSVANNAANNQTSVANNAANQATSLANNAADQATSLANNANTAQTSEANAAAAQAAAMDRLVYSTTTPKAPGAGVTPTLLTINPEDSVKLNEAVGAQLDGMFGGNPVAPQALAQIQIRAAELYQTTRNSQLAIAQAIGEANLQPVDLNDGYFRDTTQMQSSIADVLAPPAAAPPAAAPPAAAPPAAAPPVTSTDKAGRTIVWDVQAGAWKYVGPVVSP